MSNFDGPADAPHETPFAEVQVEIPLAPEQQIPDCAGLPPEASQEDANRQEVQEFIPIQPYAAEDNPELTIKSTPPIPSSIVAPPAMEASTEEEPVAAIGQVEQVIRHEPTDLLGSPEAPPQLDGDSSESPEEGALQVSANDRSREGETQEEGADFDQVRDLARQYTEVIVEKLQTVEDVNRTEVVKDLSCALVHTDGPEAAHAFAKEKSREFSMSCVERVSLWTDLYKEGDAQALPEADRAVLQTSEYPPNDDECNNLHERTAERLVSLVKAGDIDSAGYARKFIMHSTSIPPQVQSGMYAALYEAGDEEAFNAAYLLDRNTRIVKGNEENDSSDTEGRISDTQAALTRIGVCAAQRGNFDHALKVEKALENTMHKTEVHIALSKAGRKESSWQALEYLKYASGRSGYDDLQRKFAETGYKPAQAKLASRVAAEPSESYSVSDRAADLVALHKSGDQGAANTLEEMVLAQPVTNDYTEFLEAVGKTDVAHERLAQVRDARVAAGEDVSEIDRAMLKLRSDVSNWRSTVENLLQAGNSKMAAILVRDMAERTKRDSGSDTL